MSADFDVLIIGGGINGAGIANQAAQAGLSVLLVEQDDLAAQTSSRSSKLIHGGLRYLEHHAFRLVREALAEREILLGMAPHIIWPLDFVLPVSADTRPAWMLRAGLLLYDHLGARKTLPPSRRIDLRTRPEGRCLRPDLHVAFCYADCWVDDARLVLFNALQAEEFGASIRTRTRLTGARRADGRWHADLCSADGVASCCTARALVNAAGPWVTQVPGLAGTCRSGTGVRLVKGSHIVVPRLHAGGQAYLLQNDDGRVVFVLPYGAYSLIGTTDVPFDGDPARVEATPDEIAYLCRAVNRYFARPVGPDDVVWHFAGVRALYDDGAVQAQAVTRDYRLECDRTGGAPLLTVFGGKITTYRRLALSALARLAPDFPQAVPPASPPPALPGGVLPVPDLGGYLRDLARRFPFMPRPALEAMLRRQGSRCEGLLDGTTALGDLGRDFGGGLYEREVCFMREEEWARSADDVLWRRSKAGLAMSPAERAAFAGWWDARGG